MCLFLAGPENFIMAEVCRCIRDYCRSEVINSHEQGCPNLDSRRRQPTARVPSVARGTIFNGTLSELKYINYDLIKN